MLISNLSVLQFFLFSVRRRMRVENGDVYGAVRSHLYDKYPECIEPKFVRSKRD